MISDDMAVMYGGKILEYGKTENVIYNPSHPYTKALLSAIPVPRLREKKGRILLKGEITSPIDPKPGHIVCHTALLRVKGTLRGRLEIPVKMRGYEAERRNARGRRSRMWLPDEDTPAARTC